MENNHIAKSTPKDVFLYLLNILTFYISVIGLITLYIQYISALFPDPLNFYYTSMANGIRWAASVLIVAVPVYILTSWLIAKDFIRAPEKREMKLRKWLVYFTLFISAVTIIIDLMTFVYNFLSGEMTIQFFLKILVVLLLAVAVFGYYIWDLRRHNLKSNTPRILAWAVSAAVLISIAAGFFIIGTPTTQRARRFDEERVSDLQVLQDRIINYWTQKQALPQNLGQLEDSISGFMPPTDPESELVYEYNLLGPLSFELCANFKTKSYDLGPDPYQSRPMSVYGDYNQNWSHQSGRVCFERTIDPELYKPNPDLLAPGVIKPR